jgi:hypothetical protein
MEHDPSGASSAAWGSEYATPLEAVVALSWKLGQLISEDAISFGDSIATIRQPYDEPDDDTAKRWHEFTKLAVNTGTAEIIMHGKRWLVSRDELECVEGPGPDCSGPVYPHESVAGTGAVYPRCDGHYTEKLRVAQEIAERYPAHPPADFDPSYAGESWYEEEY